VAPAPRTRRERRGKRLPQRTTTSQGARHCRIRGRGSKECDRPGHEVIDQLGSAGELVDDDLLRLWPELACGYLVSGSKLDLHERRAGHGSADLKVHALRGVDFDISAGEVIVLLGPSGSGKSTLLNIMGGLDHATSGRLFFRQLELTGLNDRDLTRYRRRHVGFVFQFYNLVPSLTAYENVALVTEIAEQPMRPEEALALVGLQSRIDHFPAQLSGGEQQRVAIARAIAKRPEVLLCDEPTGALDSKTGILVIEALLAINARLGTTTLIITHNASIRDIADRVLFFADGRISRIQKNETRRAAATLTW
jgi:putative ABC transport system ATP-binding protein